MKALVFSDIHGDRTALERLMNREADYYFAAGDLANFGRGMDQLGPILQRRANRVYVIPGNHESAADVSGFCEQFGLHDFHGQSIQVDGVTIAGLGYSNITPFHTPGEYSEADLAQKLNAFAASSRLIVVAHCPPKNSKLDRAGEGKHFGSPAVREFIERVQPAYFFCGHIHEAAGAVDQIGRTTAVNVGKAGYLLDLDAAGRAS